jgi:hypothetical protein
MSRKHNTRHGRTPGGYRRRLEARGLSKAPTMPDLDSLRKKQGIRRVQPGSLLVPLPTWEGQ